ncbi:MAG: glycosyltransferase family 2 protein [Patescibacteria group bacterium]|jgi:GT2 family glycosyltransferase
MKLSIIIVSYNTKELLEDCLESIVNSLTSKRGLKFATDKKNPNFGVANFNSRQNSRRLKSANSGKKDKLSLNDLEVIIVDNNSTDGSQEYLGKLKTQNSKLKTETQSSKLKNKSEKQLPNLKIILNDENAGFAKANNQGIKKARGEYVLFLNPDTVVYPNTLYKTINYLAQHEDVGLITCRVELADGSLQKECHRGFPTPWRAFCHFSGLGKIFPNSRIFSSYFLGHLPKNTVHEIDACVGAFMMTKKEVGNKIGWWDEDFFWYGEDLDFCYRVKRSGLKVIFYPKVKITHYQGASSGIKKTKSKANKETKKKVMKASVGAMRIFYQKHYQNKYPKIIGFLVMKGIVLLEKFRLWSVERQFK